MSIPTPTIKKKRTYNKKEQPKEVLEFKQILLANIGTKLKLLRNQAGVRQTKIAEILRTNYHILYQLEKGKHGKIKAIPLDLVCLLCAFYGADMSWLLKDVDARKYANAIFGDKIVKNELSTQNIDAVEKSMQNIYKL